ncbi:AAA family ATPase [Psychrobacter sp. I-STPA6b]|uniref:AAA family ATPase n=1 Tax=Psychrobacter sp. I-STPA6b TaxID=2585718 RepID=UPI001D0C046D
MTNSIRVDSPISSDISQKTQSLLAKLNEIILDKSHVTKLALTCILANGHLLLQDLPGMGKTTLAHGLANLLGLQFNRVQFTNDMLPADILGMSLYHQAEHRFEFRQGPIFTQLLLADEINRSSPKTQSALLEAMEERQVTHDSETYALPEPFFVIATQNPTQQSGVYPLPESQLDRFLMCLSLGYPSEKAERALLAGENRRDLLQQLSAIMNSADVIQAQQDVKTVFVADVVIDYILKLVETTRQSQEYHGLSPRAVLAIKHASQAHAYVSGNMEVTPEDVQAIFPAVADHRLGQRFIPFNQSGHKIQQTLAEQVLTKTPVLSS